MNLVALFLRNEVDSQNFALIELAAELDLGEICYGRVKCARLFMILGRVNPTVSCELKMADDGGKTLHRAGKLCESHLR